MSDYICPKCKQRHRGDHECPEDGQAMLDRIRELEKKVRRLEQATGFEPDEDT